MCIFKTVKEEDSTFKDCKSENEEKKAITLIAGHTADLGYDPSPVDLQ